MELERLKERLQTIAQQDYQAEKTEVQELLPEMLRSIGSVNSELRDTLIYSTLATWISRGIFTPDELQMILQQALDDEHLFYKLGEENTDSVFTRAFSVLLIPPILWFHRQQPFLKSETLHDTLQKVLFYLYSEKDLRGFVLGNGWAHAVAHTADVLDEFVQCHELGRDELNGVLELIAEVASTEKSVYTHGEDERLSFAVVNAFKRAELNRTDKEAWLDWFTSFVYKAGETPDPEGYRSFINIKHFLRTLYFSLLQNDALDKDGELEKIQSLLQYYATL
jgi:hypothetical protein